MGMDRYFRYLAKEIAEAETSLESSNRKLGLRKRIAAGKSRLKAGGCQMLHPEQGQVRNPCGQQPCIVMITLLGTQYRFCCPSHALVWLAAQVDDLQHKMEAN